MLTRKEAFKMAMDIDGHMNDSSQGIDLSWDSIEKLVNEAYAKGAAEEREACAKVCENGTFLHEFSPEAKFSRACARAIRARGGDHEPVLVCPTWVVAVRKDRPPISAAGLDL